MKQLLAMLKATADGAFVVDQHGNVVFWNHAAERMLGYRESEVLGRPCHEVIQGQSLCGLPLCSANCAIASRLAFERAVRNFDMQTRTKGGRRIWLNMSSLPFPSRKNQPWMAAHLFVRESRARRMPPTS
jgi:PAS domain S-box-containing protein